jgi:hypothetical protein
MMEQGRPTMMRPLKPGSDSCNKIEIIIIMVVVVVVVLVVEQDNNNGHVSGCRSRVCS